MFLNSVKTYSLKLDSKKIWRNIIENFEIKIEWKETDLKTPSKQKIWNFIKICFFYGIELKFVLKNCITILFYKTKKDENIVKRC